jgi:hypothetical protein
VGTEVLCPIVVIPAMHISVTPVRDLCHVTSKKRLLRRICG